LRKIRISEQLATNTGEPPSEQTKAEILFRSPLFRAHILSHSFHLAAQRFVLSEAPAADSNNTDQHEQNYDGVDTILMTKTGNIKQHMVDSSNDT
jgi:hypothetical protein